MNHVIWRLRSVTRLEGFIPFKYYTSCHPEGAAGHDSFSLLQVIAAAKKRGQEKAKLTKSLIVLDVKPWDDTTGDQQTRQGWAAVRGTLPSSPYTTSGRSCLPLHEGLCSSAQPLAARRCTTLGRNRVCCSCLPLRMKLLNVWAPPQDASSLQQAPAPALWGGLHAELAGHVCSDSWALFAARLLLALQCQTAFWCPPRQHC